MNGTLKLKAEWLSTDGGKTWICIHQYFLTDPQSRTSQNNTLEGDFAKGKDKALQRVNEFPFPPTAVIDSDHGYHVYWH